MKKKHLIVLCMFLVSGACGVYGEDPIGYPRFMQGPMVGTVTPDSITIWGRLSGAYRGEIEVDNSIDFADPITLAISAEKENDYVLKWKIDGLQPDTRYYYRFKVEGDVPRYQRGLPAYHTKTAPAEGTKGRFSVAYGSCPRFQLDRRQDVWTTIHQFQPDLFFWLGDNIYGDSLDPEILAEEYRRQFDVAAFQPVMHTIPQLAVWDDHDFGLNDYDRRHPRKAEALEVFERYWANPAYGLPETPGVFFEYRYGGVDFFFIDCRYYRDPNKEPDHPGKTMLGRRQLEWLQEALQRSEAPFKVLISGSGWSKGKGPGGDSWASYLHERDILFDFIRDHEISGVILLSGDTHRGELNAIPWSDKGGYDFYDLVSSPLGQTPNPWDASRKPEIRIRKVFSREVNFGLLEFDLSGEPTLRFTLVGKSGREAWEPLVIRADELVNGVASWPDKMVED
jgi:alkaline phosphatase D